MPIVKPARGLRLNKTHPLTRGIVGYWLFNEGSGDKVFDLSGNGNDGVLTNGVLWVPGKFGSSTKHDGDDDFIELGTITTSNLLQLNGNLTIIVQINPILTGDGFQRIIDKSTAGNAANGYTLWIHTDGQLGFQIDATMNFRSDVGAVTANISQQIALVGNGSTYQYYLDGKVINGAYTVGSYTVPVLAQTNMRIGTWNHDVGREYKGKISHVSIYNRALSASEIALLYREPFCMFERAAPARYFSIPVTVVARRSHVGFKPIEGAGRLRGLGGGSLL